MHCEACNADNGPSARFCFNCGAELGGNCRHCGAELPPHAHFCSSCGQAALASGVTAGKALAISERKQVTVLFADFSGFTAYADKVDPEEVRDQMASLWGHLDALIKARGGTVEKHIGDAMMAVFGARQAHEEDPEQAVRAALEMQSALR